MSLFRDTSSYLSDDYKCTEWKKYHTPLEFVGQLELKKTGETSYGLDVFCCEPELAGYGLSATIIPGFPDLIESDKIAFSFKPPVGAKLDDSTDDSPKGFAVATNSEVSTNADFWTSLPTYEHSCFAYPVPGIAVRWSKWRPDGAAQSINRISTFSSGSPYWAGFLQIPEDLKLDKVYDGGYHCWIHPTNEDVGNTYVAYSDPLPSEIFRGGNNIAVAFNYLKNKPSYAFDVSYNRTFTLALWGTIDGENWTRIDAMIDDLDLLDEIVVVDGGSGVGHNAKDKTYQGFLNFGMGLNWGKYSQYKLGWFIKDEADPIYEAQMLTMNFCKLGIYSI